MAGIVNIKDRVRLFLCEVGEEPTMENKIGHVVSIGDIGKTAETIDVTTLESEVRESAKGFEEIDDIEVTQNLNSDEYTKMQALSEAETNMVLGIDIRNNVLEPVLGLKIPCIVGNVSLTGLEMEGVIQVVTAFKVNGEITSDFVAPDTGLGE